MDHTTFMREALAEAVRAAERGDVGVGAVVVLDGAIVARGGNRANTTGDPFAHAETDAMRQVPRLDLSAATLYTSFDPCPMCFGALLVRRVGTVVIGARRPRGTSTYAGLNAEAMAELAGRTDVVPGPLAAECLKVRAPAR
ncbi:nucleoside deaminase [Nonomuraea insulae]|uniref:Nucleoside deaminase n=1 Tax=Nonomuraea insulae TaxID=1616787 RepID=A0ABW1DBJ0_9ACTN